MLDPRALVFAVPIVYPWPLSKYSHLRNGAAGREKKPRTAEDRSVRRRRFPHRRGTRAGSHSCPQMHNSLCSNRSSLRRDSQSRPSSSSVTTTGTFFEFCRKLMGVIRSRTVPDKIPARSGFKSSCHRPSHDIRDLEPLLYVERDLCAVIEGH